LHVFEFPIRNPIYGKLTSTANARRGTHLRRIFLGFSVFKNTGSRLASYCLSK